MEIKDHFGVYGVCLQDGKLLCIEKTRGPYQQRFDLPGGSQELQSELHRWREYTIAETSASRSMVRVRQEYGSMEDHSGASDRRIIR